MNLKTNVCCFMAVAVFLTCGLYPAMAEESKKFRVLVVMSYEENYKWVQEIRKGIDSELEKICEIRYAYLNTKTNLKAAPEKAKEVYALYHEFQPDGVIAADDDAQTLFAVPYLKDKVKTPVIFCGVNSEPEKYGYPASNVSGVLERSHIKESLAFAQQIVPSVKTFGYIASDSSTSRAILAQIQNESDGYTAKFSEYRFFKTLEEMPSVLAELKNRNDLLLVETLEGIQDKDGKPLPEKEIVRTVAKLFGKPTITSADLRIKYGILCAVVRTGQEQGQLAADMMAKVLHGTPVSDLPIIRNHNGKRIINVTVLKELGITPRPEILGSAELVRTEE